MSGYDDLLSSLAANTDGGVSSYRYPSTAHPTSANTASSTYSSAPSSSVTTSSSTTTASNSAPHVSYSQSLMNSSPMGSAATAAAANLQHRAAAAAAAAASPSTSTSHVTSPPQSAAPTASSSGINALSPEPYDYNAINLSGPLPAAAGGVRSFVEFGQEESDVEFVQSQLDYHWGKCKEEVMARLIARQRRLEDEQRRLDTFRASYVTHVNALQEEIEKLKEMNMTKDRDITRMKSQQENMVNAWSIRHQKVVALRAQAFVYNTIRQAFLEEQRRKYLTKKFVHPHYRKKLLLHVMSSWRSSARTSKRVADEAYWRRQIQETSANLIQDYEKNLAELRHQLAQAEDVIRYHHEDQAMMEEKLKQAFIRGVCALNREALSVFTTPAEVAEANIRSHFSTSTVGTGAFISNPATGGVNAPTGPPPATNPSASASTAANAAGAKLTAAQTGPSAPLPSSFVQPTGGAASTGSRPGSAGGVNHPRPGAQLPYPAHSHAPPTSRGSAPQPHAYPHSHPHPHPHPSATSSSSSYSHPLPRSSATGPQARATAPRPYGK